MQQECVPVLRNANLKLNSDSKWCILLVFLGVKSPQPHLLPSAPHFYVFSFNSIFLFAILSCFNPNETFHLAFYHVCSAMFVYIRIPPNNPIIMCMPGLDPSLSLLSEVSHSSHPNYPSNPSHPNHPNQPSHP